MELNVDEVLKLRSLAIGDSQQLFDLTEKNRNHLREWLPWLDSNLALEDTQEFIDGTIQQEAANNGITCAIVKNEKIVGVCGHHKINWSNRSVLIGYWLDKDEEGQGIITKATKKILEYSFEVLDLNLVEISAATSNEKSKAIPERLGFKFEGVLRQREWLYDHFVDHAIYSILKSEWLEDF